MVKVAGEDTTELAIDGSFSVTGPLETFANAGGVHVARALLAEFSANHRQAGGRAPAGRARCRERRRAARGTTATADAAAELSAGSLMWRAFLSWLRA